MYIFIYKYIVKDANDHPVENFGLYHSCFKFMTSGSENPKVLKKVIIC